MSAPVEKTVRITNKRGLHARAAAKFVKLVEQSGVKVSVSKDGMTVGGDSIMGLLMLSASLNTQISISVAGGGAEKALAELCGLVERQFDEE